MRDPDTGGAHEINVRPRGHSFDKGNDIIRNKGSQGRTDTNQTSASSSSKNGDKKRNILNDLNNRKGNMSPKGMLNNKVLSNHMRKGLKLGESPYVDKVLERE